MSAADVPLEHVADVLGHDGTRMAALVYRHVLAPTVEAGVAPMQALPASDRGEPGEAIGSPDGSPGESDEPGTQRRSRLMPWSHRVETMGLEPTTPCLQSRCSSQLSYVPWSVDQRTGPSEHAAKRPANPPWRPPLVGAPTGSVACATGHHSTA